ncbi:MAG: RimK family alpha-L-glutamate ligase [Bacilli bacterium]|nr:RimK family alpha-L-glutamate ligase [Bacilli bacterium]
MLKTGLAILNAYIQTPASLHFYKRMKEELGSLGIALDYKTNAEILSYIASSGDLFAKEIEKYNFVLYLDKDLYISEMLAKAGVKLFDSAEAIRLCDDKMLTYITLSNRGIKMPKTISAPLNYAGIDDEAFVKQVAKELSFPIVAKDNFGSLGKEVYLIKNYDELVSFEKEHKFSAHLYQQFIESSKGHDFRIIVINGKVVASMKRSNDNGDFRSNVAQGGHGEVIELPASFAEAAEKAAKILNLDYCGVDLLDDKEGNPVLCEVNSNAFLQEIERITGKNIAGVYAKHIVDALK